MSSGPRFDRRVPAALLEALAGPFNDLVPRPEGPFALDLQLRALPQASDRQECWKAHATLHLGHAMVIELHIDENCHFCLAGQATRAEGSEFREPYTKFFKKPWSRPNSVDELNAISQGRATYVEAIVKAARPKHTAKEGGLQVALSNWPEDFVVIDRESVPQGLTKDHLEAALRPVGEALRTLQSSGKRWTKTRRVPDPTENASDLLAGKNALVPGSDEEEPRLKPDKKGFGPELDCLAVDRQGRVLVIEAKHASDTGGVGWTPAQVAVYLRLFQACAADVPDLGDILEEMLKQRQKLGLAPKDLPEIRSPLEFVPVIAIGGTLDRSRPEANRRMVAVIDALADAGEPLEGLQIWQLASEDYGQDGFGNVDPGELR